MTVLDGCLVVALVAAAVRGLMRGFLLEIAGPSGLVLGLGAAVRWTAEWEGLARSTLLLPDPLPAAAAFVGIASTGFLSVLVVAAILDRGLRRGMLRPLNRMLGGMLGAAKGAVLIAALLLLLDWTYSATVVGAMPLRGRLATPLAEAARGWLHLSAAGVDPIQEP